MRHIDDIAARSGDLAARNISSRRLARITTPASATGSGSSRSATARRRSASSSTSGSSICITAKTARTDFIAFLKAIPALAELLDGASPRLDDLRFYSHLPYVSKQYMGNGWALLGDAAAFLDPYYSPGLDHASFTAEATAEIVGMRRERRGRQRARSPSTTKRSSARTTASSARSTRTSTTTWARPICSTAAMILDTAHYYIFVVIPAYRFAKKFLWMPVLGPKPAFFSYHFIKFYNRRFKSIALARRAAGEAGARNNGRRIKAYFNLNLSPMHMVLRGVKLWMFAEADNVRLQLRRLFRRRAAATRLAGRGRRSTRMSRRVAIVFDAEFGERR